MQESQNPYLELIDSFDGEYRFLSNFWPVEIEFEGIQFSSVEGAYQAAKTLDPMVRLEIAVLPANKAKRAGKKLKIRSDWEAIKIPVMEILVRKKFQNPELKDKLLATGERPLIEGNWWGDTFWGICKEQGQNHLGRILMQVRDELKASS
jgi:ribA/ribD-fused uncharacterized protein